MCRTIFRISGNKDQIDNDPYLKTFIWQEGNHPNCVSAPFSDKHPALIIYAYMVDKKMVAFRNWLD